MKRNTTPLLIAALLTGTLAVASCSKPATDTAATSAAAAPASAGDAAASGALPADTVQYADVVNVVPVTSKEKVVATVIGSEPITKTSTTTTPKQVCEDVQVAAPRKDQHNVAGTAVGVVAGGLLGHMVGGGKGKTVATVAGAAAGGYAGNRVEQKRADAKTVTQQQCHTENATAETSTVTGYNVTYKKDDGTTGTIRTDKKPGSTITLGSQDAVQGYDVTYRYNGEEKTLRMNQKPDADRLPVINGQVVAAVGGQSQQ